MRGGKIMFEKDFAIAMDYAMKVASLQTNVKIFIWISLSHFFALIILEWSFHIMTVVFMKPDKRFFIYPKGISPFQ